MDATDNEGLPDEDTTSDHIAARQAIPLAAAIVSDTLDLSVQRVTPLVGLGAVNLILFVKTSGAEVVVRLNKPENDAAKTRGEYEKERWCLDRASAAGIPGPTVLAIGEHSGRAFMLQDRVPGVNGKQSAMAPAELFRVLGRYARMIHALPVTGFGDSVAAFENGDAQRGWRRFVDYNLGQLTDRDPLLALDVYAPNQQGAIRMAFTWLRNRPLRVGLNHGDLARRNTIVDRSGSVYLLDWGCAEMHIVPHYDLNALLRWYQPDNANLRSFIDGYGIAGDEWARLLPELNALALLKAFDLTRWAIGRCPARIAELAECAARCLTLYQGTS